MSYLLDTHIWLWSLLEPARLSTAVRTILEDPASEVWLSPISVWEFLILVERERVQIPGESDDWLNQAFVRAPVREAPLTFEIARQSRRISLPHRDPVDRFLAATASVLDFTLITADPLLLASTQFRVQPNR